MRSDRVKEKQTHQPYPRCTALYPDDAWTRLILGELKSSKVCQVRHRKCANHKRHYFGNFVLRS